MSAGVTLIATLAISTGSLCTADAARSEALLRGPYLQQATSTSVIVRWRTGEATDAIVRYGAAAGALDMSESSATVTAQKT